MFTGIIEELGKVREIKRGSQSCQLEIGASRVLTDVKLGDSIAVNGVCLTVVAFEPERFAADVMWETLRKTNLERLRTGDLVNLERALRLGDRLGGHLVLGHVDGVGRVIEQRQVDIALVTRIGCSPELLRYVLPKGSVAVDGISLTVVECLGDSFTVSLIPHTAKSTTLGWKKPGDLVNLETDIIGKYVEQLMRGAAPAPGRGIDLAFLREHGFGIK
ncbi:MAG: riboflavin synthase [Syntrophomonadaceae bacterium]|nr:riboflavin synthase [Syntrophomonadaceae bacterium]